MQQFCRRLARNDATLTICNLHNASYLLGNSNSRGALQLAHALKASTHLVVLFLDNAGIGPTGAQALAGSLRHQPSLRYLYLSYNSMGNRGATAMAEVLDDSSSKNNNNNNSCAALQVLKLAHNQIGNAGASRIAEALQHNGSLQQLDLHGNDIQAEGLCAMADSLRHNTQLKLLHLQGNLWRHSCRHLAERRAVQERFLQVLMGNNSNNDNHNNDHHHNQTLHQLRIDQCTCPQNDTATLQTANSMYQNSSSRTPHCWPQEVSTCGRIDFFLALNRLGRPFFGSLGLAGPAWARVLAAAESTDLLYTLLQTRPDLLVVTSVNHNNNNNAATNDGCG